MSKKQQSETNLEWEYFDDCPICQGMKQGKGQTLEDLQTLFKEAENKNSESHISI